MNFSEKYRPPQAPSGKADGSEPEDKWPADFPEYCKSVEFHPDEPFMSVGDGLTKMVGTYRMQLKRNELDEDPHHERVEAVLYWLSHSENFYANNASLIQKFSTVKSLVQKLKNQLTERRYEKLGERLDEISSAQDSLGETFQLETGTLINSSVVPLFPLIGRGLNPKILQVIRNRQPRDKVAGLLKLLSDSESGSLGDEGLKTGVETLFADELK